MNPLRHAARSLRREFFAGDLLTVAAALVLGVAAMTAVGTLVDRVALALAASAAETLGGDLGVRGRQDPPAEFAAEAAARGLRSTRLVSFPSVLFHGEASQMATIKGVDAGYPLRGELRVAREADGLDATTAGAPPPGQAWADPRLLQALGVRVGDDVEFGSGQLRIAGVLQSEPDAAGELLQMAPTLLVGREEVEAAGLLGPGSRASYRLMFAGQADAVAGFADWLRPRMDGGLRLVAGVHDRRSELDVLDGRLVVVDDRGSRRGGGDDVRREVLSRQRREVLDDGEVHSNPPCGCET